MSIASVTYSIEVPKTNLADAVRKTGVSWVNFRISDEAYPFKDSFSGLWDVEVVTSSKGLLFEEIVELCRRDGWLPGTVYHMLALFEYIKAEGLEDSSMLMAPGSISIDDFECPGCVVLTASGGKVELGLGNWRGNKVSGYGIVRVRRGE